MVKILFIGLVKIYSTFRQFENIEAIYQFEKKVSHLVKEKTYFQGEYFA